MNTLEFKYIPNRPNQRGFSLVELMVAITVGLILMTGVVQMFLSSKTVFSTQQGISRVQETGRLAMEFLSKDIREAGYMGCLSRYNPVSYFSTLNDPDAFLVDFQTGIEATMAPPESLGISPLDGTPVLVIRTANGGGASLTEKNNLTSGQLFIENTGKTGDKCWSGICEEDILVLTDCAKARIFQATNVQEAGGGSKVNIAHAKQASMTPGNRLSAWGNSPTAQFEQGGEIIKIRTLTYYLGENTQERPALFLKEGFDDPVELLEGVENMNLQFGIDTNTDARVDNYVDLAGVGNWDNVLAVRVELLVQSADDNVSPEPQTYTFGGEEVTAEDRRIRQVFTSTVGIRTRIN